MSILGEGFVIMRPEMAAFGKELQAKVGEATAKVEAEQQGGALSSLGGKVFLGLAAGAALVGVESVKMATEFQASHARLATSLQDSGRQYEQYASAIEKSDAAGRKLGFTDTEQEDAMSRLVTAVHDPTVAIRDLSVAEDIARARHMDLTAATQLVTRAQEGNYGSLTRLGILTKAQTKNLRDGNDAVNLLGQAYAGQALAQAHTFGGELDALKAQGDHLMVGIGQGLIPILTGLAGGLNSTIQFFENNKAAAIGLGIVVGGPLVVAMGSYLLAQGQMLAGKVVEFFENAGTAAGKLITFLTPTTVAVEAQTVAVDADTLANEALSTSMMAAYAETGPLAAGLDTVAGAADTAATAEAGAAAGLTTILTAASGVLLPLGQVVAKFQAISAAKPGEKWGAAEGLSPKATDTLTKWNRDLEALVGIHHHAASAADTHALAVRYLQQDTTALTAAQHDLLDGTNSGIIMAGQAASASAEMTKEQQKVYDANQKLITSIGSEAGPAFGAFVAGVDMSTEQLTALEGNLKSLKSGMESSFHSATSLVQQFGTQSKVSISDVNKWLRQNLQDTQNWSANLKTLMHAGVNSGIIQELAQAGPQAAGLVASLAQNVSAGEVNLLNSTSRSVNSILSSTETQVLDYVGYFNVAGQQLGAGITSGFSQSIAQLPALAVNAIGKAKSLIHTNFKIASPSQVMADEVGRPLAEGILAGFSVGLGGGFGLSPNGLAAAIGGGVVGGNGNAGQGQVIALLQQILSALAPNQNLGELPAIRAAVTAPPPGVTPTPTPGIGFALAR